MLPSRNVLESSAVPSENVDDTFAALAPNFVQRSMTVSARANSK